VTESAHTGGVRTTAGLAEPVDVASLAVFRIAFGLIAAGECYRLVVGGHADAIWGGEERGLALLALSEQAVTLLLYAGVPLGLAIAAGFLHRASGLLLAATTGALLAATPHAPLSELQLIASTALLLALAPAARDASPAAWLGRSPGGAAAPAGALLALRAQYALVFVAVGVGMLGGDWLQGYPLRLWLPERQGLPLLGAVHAWPGTAVVASWLLLLLHLAIAPALFWRPTRATALVLWIGVQTWLQQTFDLGALPLLMILGATLFLPPGWPRGVFVWPRREGPPADRLWPAARFAAAGWLALQLVLAARPLLLPGPVAWNDGGHALSWRYLHESKGGAVSFVLVDRADGRTWQVEPSVALTPRQYRAVAVQPALTRRYARLLAARAAAEQGAEVDVRARTLVTLNGREPARLVSPEVDLAADELPPGWILPLEIPLALQWSTGDGWPPPRDELRP